VSHVPDRHALRIDHVAKSFPGIHALRDVSLDVRRGEIHALLGGNGSGKSTLLKILAGVYHADRGGTVEVDGKAIPADRTNPVFARRVGLRFVHQGDGIFPTLTVAENVGIRVGFDTRRAGRIDRRRLHRRVQELLDRFAIATRPDALALELAPPDRTMLAVGAMLHDDGAADRVFVLDEPTASLAAEQSRILYAEMRRRADAGHTILFVSHRLDEVIAVADRATVLRDGEVRGTLRRDQLAETRLVELIAGRTIERLRRPPRARRARVVLEARAVSGGPLRGVTFALHEGEVLGVAGPLGAGRSELLQALFGARAIRSGSIAVDGTAVRFSEIGDAMRAGIAYVPPDPSDGAFPDLSLSENLAAASLGESWNRVRLRRRREARYASSTIAALSVRASSPRQPMATLSAGDQQKIIVCRWLRRNPKVLLLDQPTRSVDVGARLELHRLFADTVANGAAAVVVSDDFEELALLADRVLVMEHGRVVTELVAASIDAGTIAALALGSPASSA
jgi:ribose transport system ATP-binding protein